MRPKTSILSYGQVEREKNYLNQAFDWLLYVWTCYNVSARILLGFISNSSVVLSVSFKTLCVGLKLSHNE